ncbi:hypothetical protein ACLIA0_10060 [Bacillaceae bacterium W0354]
MSRKKQQEIIAEGLHPDGFKEGVMNDPTGVQHGIYMDSDEIHPQEIARIRKESIKTMETNADQEREDDQQEDESEYK